MRRTVPGVVIAPPVVTVAVVTVAVVVAHCVDGKTVPKNGAQSQQRDSYPASHVILLQQPAAQPDSIISLKTLRCRSSSTPWILASVAPAARLMRCVASSNR